MGEEGRGGERKREANLGQEEIKILCYIGGSASPGPARVNSHDMLIWTPYHLNLKHFYEMLQKVLEYPISDGMVELRKCHLPE